MIAVLQRVNSASCAADGVFSGRCGKGLLLLVGAASGDTEDDCRFLADKIAKLRVFSDENGRMNLSVNDVSGSVLIVSNFTLLANYAHGNRPDFLSAEKPERARALYEDFVSLMRERVGAANVGCGVFGADMQIEASLDGPVTIVMDSVTLKSKK